MKIAVMGHSGAGKSTLARRLAEGLGCPLLHLDQVNFASGWRERDRADAAAEVAYFLEQDAWVIDGNYKALHWQRRLREADWIVLLNFPRRVCLRQALIRYFHNQGKSRESMAEGCAEKMDWEFFRWIVWDSRSPERRADERDIVRRYGSKTAVLKDRRQVEAFLRVRTGKGG